MGRKQPERGSPHLCALTKEGQVRAGQSHNFPWSTDEWDWEPESMREIYTVCPTHLQTTSWQALPHPVYYGRRQYPSCTATPSEHTCRSCKPLHLKVEWKLSWEHWLCNCKIICAWLTEGGSQVSELHDQNLWSNLSVPADWRWESWETKGDIISQGPQNALCYFVGWG